MCSVQTWRRYQIKHYCRTSAAQKSGFSATNFEIFIFFQGLLLISSQVLPPLKSGSPNVILHLALTPPQPDQLHHNVHHRLQVHTTVKTWWFLNNLNHMQQHRSTLIQVLKLHTNCASENI